MAMAEEKWKTKIDGWIEQTFDSSLSFRLTLRQLMLKCNFSYIDLIALHLENIIVDINLFD